jgi:hypothetical protein
MRITIVRGQEDWEGLYIDGKCVQQRHSLEVWDVLEAVQEHGGYIKSLQGFTLNDQAEQVLNDLGNLPDDLDEVHRWEAE